MELDVSVKYKRIVNKFLEGIIRLFVLVIIHIIFQIIIKGRFEMKNTFISFGGFLLVILVIAIINETIDYNQKYYQLLSNKNYLKVRQKDNLQIKIKDQNKFLRNLESQVLEAKKGWLISKKNKNILEFQTKKKSLMNYFLEDKVIITIENVDKVLIESSPVNKIVFLDSSRNLGNILFVKNEIKKAAVNIT